MNSSTSHPWSVCWGGIDSKVSSFAFKQGRQVLAISGPTQQQPAFDFNDTLAKKTCRLQAFVLSGNGSFNLWSHYNDAAGKEAQGQIMARLTREAAEFMAFQARGFVSSQDIRDAAVRSGSTRYRAIAITPGGRPSR